MGSNWGERFNAAEVLLVERVLGKDEAAGSIPAGSSEQKVKCPGGISGRLRLPCKQELKTSSVRIRPRAQQQNKVRLYGPN